jgi:hypothetical protein
LAAAKPEQSYRRRFFASAALGRALYPRFPRCSASPEAHFICLLWSPHSRAT